MRPANAEVPLRLKSPSRPWPMASCSRMPGQPGPEHHGHRAGGRRHAPRDSPAPGAPPRARAPAAGRRRPVRRASSVRRSRRSPARAGRSARRCTDTLKRTSGRTSAASSPSLLATSMTSCTAITLAITCTTRGSMRARLAVDALEPRHLLCVARASQRIHRQVQAGARPAAARRCTRRSPPLRPRWRARRARLPRAPAARSHPNRQSRSSRRPARARPRPARCWRCRP